MATKILPSNHQTADTVAAQFCVTVRDYPDRVALRWKDGDDFRQLTWAEYSQSAGRAAQALSDLGLEKGQRVVLMMRNRPEFHIADMATVLLGATPVSIYNSSSPEQIEYLATHCEATVAIVEDVELLDRFMAVRNNIPTLKYVVVIDDDKKIPAEVLRWSTFLEGESIDIVAAAAKVLPTDLATVIYTSGTTGPPKGVMLDHANVMWTVNSLLECWRHQEPYFSRMISYLPMAHVAERMNTHYQGIAGVFEVTTCPDAAEIGKYLAESRPQIFFGVPRVWEKLQAGVMAMARANPEQLAMLEAALPIGERVSEYRARGEDLPAGLAAELTGAQPVFDFVLNLLGLDQVISAISGAAPIPMDTLKFFRCLGLEMSEIYGLSETSGPMTWEPFRVHLGTVGPPIPGCEVTLADDGEVMSRGGNIFRGYLNDPERTGEVLDANGWFASGDIGEFDADGYLKIIDRKKELIITAGGKNISPANLEAALKGFPLIGQVCVIGDQRPFLSAIVVLDAEVAPAWATQHGIETSDLALLAHDPKVVAEIESNVAEVNKKYSRAEQIKKFTVLDAEWLPDSEELTPTMKLKRRGVNSKYSAQIEAMYA